MANLQNEADEGTIKVGDRVRVSLGGNRLGVYEIGEILSGATVYAFLRDIEGDDHVDLIFVPKEMQGNGSG